MLNKPEQNNVIYSAPLLRKSFGWFLHKNLGIMKKILRFVISPIQDQKWSAHIWNYLDLHDCSCPGTSTLLTKTEFFSTLQQVHLEKEENLERMYLSIWSSAIPSSSQVSWSFHVFWSKIIVWQTFHLVKWSKDT